MLYPAIALADVSEVRGEVSSDANPSSIKSLFETLDPYVFWALVCLLGFMVIGFMVYRWWRNKVYTFPLFDVPKRIGGNHAAGVGAVIAFKNHQLSPSNQRNKEAEFFSEI